jgi:hypothetical protein
MFKRIKNICSRIVKKIKSFLSFEDKAPKADAKKNIGRVLNVIDITKPKKALSKEAVDILMTSLNIAPGKEEEALEKLKSDIGHNGLADMLSIFMIIRENTEWLTSKLNTDDMRSLFKGVDLSNSESFTMQQNAAIMKLFVEDSKVYADESSETMSVSSVHLEKAAFTYLK